MGLADRGSQVSCLSESYYTANLHIFGECPVLQVIGTSVIGAKGGRPMKLKRQVFVKLKTDELEQRVVFLIIPELTMIA